MNSHWFVGLPILLIGLLVTAFIQLRPFSALTQTTPPLEDVSFERVRFDDAGIHLRLRAAGSETVMIAQVMVDGAYWNFTSSHPQGISHLDTADLHIPYPWVEGEAHELVLISSNGATFPHTIEVAVSRPSYTNSTVFQLVTIGLFVGFIPILIGYGFMPTVRHFGSSGYDFALALTLALLTFLLIDTMSEALELSTLAAAALKAPIAVWGLAILTTFALMAFGRRHGSAPQGRDLALFIALGIGLHNLGEGAIIGASIAVGEVALASLLVLGFFLHNVTEGIAIAAPLQKIQRYSRISLFILALLAGIPASIGAMLGAYTYSPYWAALVFAIGTGAILQVIIEVGLALWRIGNGQARKPWPALTGFSIGLLAMYLTTLLIYG